jgi:hypothetical protein
MAYAPQEFDHSGAENLLTQTTPVNSDLALTGQIPPGTDSKATRVAMAGSQTLRDFGDLIIRISDPATAGDTTAGQAKPGAAAEGAKSIDPTTGAKVEKGEDAAKSAANAARAEVKVPRLDHFDAKQTPADHFRFTFGQDVTASGRPVPGEKNLLGLVELMHPELAKIQDPVQKEQALREAAKRTAIMDLRTLGDPALASEPKILKLNDSEITQEMANASKLGIAYSRVEMNSHEVQSPQKIEGAVKTMYAWTHPGHDASGSQTPSREVDVHCFHGTDRTGLVVTSYKATYDPRLNDLIKNHGSWGVERAYQELKQELLTYGCEPSSHDKIFLSLHQYLQYLHDGPAKYREQPVKDYAIGPLQQQALRDAHAILSKPSHATLDAYTKVLSEDIKRFDPATHTALYRQLKDEFNRDYVDQNAAH